MKTRSRFYKIEPIPRMRRFVFDAGQMGRRRHIIHGLIEVDVTLAREALRVHKAATGEALSFTAYVIACLGRALELNEHLYAHRDWRNRLIIFDEVTVTAMIETEVRGKKIPLPHIFKAINKKSFREIHTEMRASQKAPAASSEGRFMRWITYLPGFLRRGFFQVVIKFPTLLPEISSSVLVTAVGMFGEGGGWGIPMSNYTLGVTVGGIVKKPGVVGDQIAIREYLDLTLSIDHDIVDGAPAARFTSQFKSLIESGYGLVEQEVAT